MILFDGYLIEYKNKVEHFRENSLNYSDIPKDRRYQSVFLKIIIDI